MFPDPGPFILFEVVIPTVKVLKVNNSPCSLLKPSEHLNSHISLALLDALRHLYFSESDDFSGYVALLIVIADYNVLFYRLTFLFFLQRKLLNGYRIIPETIVPIFFIHHKHVFFVPCFAR